MSSTPEERAALRRSAAAARERPYFIAECGEHDEHGMPILSLCYGTEGDPSDTYDLLDYGELPDWVFLACAANLAPRLADDVDRLQQLPEWLIAKLKTLGEYYEPPTDGRDAIHEIYGWMHVLCFHYVQNRREVKEYDAARREAKALRADVDRLTAERDEARARLLTAAGDDLCRLTQEEIKAMSAGTVKIPPKEEFLASCERFHAQVANESGIMSNCLTLAQLVAESEQQRATVSRLEAALRQCKTALAYAGIGQKYPFDRLGQLLEAERAKCRNDDDRDYWTFLLEKLRVALAAINALERT